MRETTPLRSPDRLIDTMLALQQKLVENYSSGKIIQNRMGIIDIPCIRAYISLYTDPELINKPFNELIISIERSRRGEAKSVSRISLFFDKSDNDKERRYRVAGVISRGARGMELLTSPGGESDDYTVNLGECTISESTLAGIENALLMTAATTSLEEKLPFPRDIRRVLQGEVILVRNRLIRRGRKCEAVVPRIIPWLSGPPFA